MSGKPTCEELEQKVKQLEKKVQDLKGVEDALKDYIAYQSVLSVVRSVGAEQPEEMLIQTFLSEIVKQYGFCMSWYGQCSDGKIRPILSAGRVDRYLDNLVLEIREPTSPDAQCAMSQAILSGAPFTYADLERDEGFRQWRDYALELGYRSNLALPLEVDSQVEGGFMVYAETPNAFPEERIERLQLLRLEISAILARRRIRQKAEEALRVSEEQLRTFMDSMTDFFAVTDKSENLIYVNRSMAEKLGYSKEEMIGMHISSIISEESMVNFIAEVKELVEKGKLSIEATWLTKDGKKIHGEINANAIYDSDGNYTGSRGVFRDITERKRAEEALKESEQRFRELADLLPQPVFELDLDGNFTYSNRCGFETFGYSQKDLENGVNALELFIPEERQRVWQNIQKRLTGIEFEDHEYTGLGKDSSKFPMLVYSAPIVSNNKLVGVRGIVLDISKRKRAEEALQKAHDEMETRVEERTAELIKVNQKLKGEIEDRKLAENALRESEERFRKIVQGARAGYFFIDRDGLWKDVNEAWLEMHGYSTREEVIGKHFSLTQVDDDMEMAQKHVENLLTGVTIESGEFSRRCKDGSVAYHTFSAGPVVRGEEILGLEGFIIDDTERKHVEEALRESERKYRTLFEDSRDAIYITSREGLFIDINQAALDLFGYTREEMIGMNAKQTYVNPDDRRGFQQEVEKHGSIRHYEVKLCKKDGTKMYCLLTSSVRRSIDGNIIGYQGIIHDVTEQKRLESTLQQVHKLEAIGTLAGGIAHDFNNLLMGIQGNVSLVLMNMDPTHAHYERLMNIEKQVESGARLTSHLLGYARKGKYEVKAVDLNQLVEEASETFGRTRKQFTIHREFADGLFAIKADAGQIEQVLLNLFVNAADAMPSGGELILKTENVTHEQMTNKVYDPKPGKYVLLMVTDTGVGMSRKTMARIFDPFFTTKEMGRGTGLGLASAYGIIKAHAGYIDVKSKKGVGTTFSIYLPASERKVEKAVKPAERFVKGTETVLLVDDEDVVLEVGKELLETMGYRVLIAKDGEEAVEVYKNNFEEIDIVVLDMVMPNMGGGEAYDRMRKINPDIKVLLSSGYSIDGEATEILKRGCDGFIQKPFKMKDLSAKVREVLGKG